MKKPIIAATLIVCLVAWCVRYYKVNGGTFAVHYEGPSAVYSMHEMVSFGDNISNNALEQPGYSVSLESARMIDAEDYLKELGKKPEDFHFLSEKYLELTLTVANEGDYPKGLTFYALPVLGSNWFTYYDNEVTACINPFFEGDYDQAHACAVRTNTSTTVKIAYNLYERHFLPNQFKNLEHEKMWLSVTTLPVDQRIAFSCT